MRWLTGSAIFAGALCLSSWALANGSHTNQFASIFVDDKKIGHVHYSIKTSEQGVVEELRTRASLSVFGIKLYDFNQDLHEKWSTGELQDLQGTTNDDGKIDKTTVRRMQDDYQATLNDKPLTLPHKAFPISLWHYAISQQTLLFDLTDLTLMTVTISSKPENVERAGKSIPTERFDFAGDWKGSVWFDDDKQFVKAEYKSKGRTVIVLMDP
jgi:hypothetical protein